MIGVGAAEAGVGRGVGVGVGRRASGSERASARARRGVALDAVEDPALGGPLVGLAPPWPPGAALRQRRQWVNVGSGSGRQGLQGRSRER